MISTIRKLKKLYIHIGMKLALFVVIKEANIIYLLSLKFKANRAIADHCQSFFKPFQLFQEEYVNLNWEMAVYSIKTFNRMISKFGSVELALH